MSIVIIIAHADKIPNYFEGKGSHNEVTDKQYQAMSCSKAKIGLPAMKP